MLQIHRARILLLCLLSLVGSLAASAAQLAAHLDPAPVYYTIQRDLELGGGVASMSFDGVRNGVVGGYEHATGLAFDSKRNMYFGSRIELGEDDYHIMRISPDGVLTDLGVAFNATVREISWSFDLAVNSADELYFTFQRNPQWSGIGKRAADGSFEIVRDGFTHATGLCFDSHDNLYFGSRELPPEGAKYYLMRLTPDGDLSNLGLAVFAVGRELSWSFDLAANRADEIYYTIHRDPIQGSGIGKYTRDGVFQPLVSNIDHATALCVDAQDNVYFASRVNDDGYRKFYLMRLSPSGELVNRGVALTLDVLEISWSFDLAAGPEPVQLLSPAASESFEGNTLIDVHWNSDLTRAGSSVGFELYNAQGVIQHLGYAWDPDGDDHATVLLPLALLADDYYIRAYSLWDPTLAGISAPFTITGGAIRVYYPTPGMNLSPGETIPVHWRSSIFFAGYAMHVELIRDGQPVADFGDSIDADGESVKFVTLGELPPSSQYAIRVTSYWDPTLYGESALFKLSSRLSQTAVPLNHWALYQ